MSAIGFVLLPKKSSIQIRPFTLYSPFQGERISIELFKPYFGIDDEEASKLRIRVKIANEEIWDSFGCESGSVEFKTLEDAEYFGQIIIEVVEDLNTDEDLWLGYSIKVEGNEAGGNNK